MPRQSPTPLVFGTTSVHSKGSFKTPEAIASLFSVLRQSGITTIDTAQLYGDSEATLGGAGVAAQGFTLDTKAPGGFIPGSFEPTKLAADAHRSVKLLGVDKLDVFYLHGPDPAYPLEQTLSVANSLHAEGLFARLGMSNFSAAEVEAAHDICAAKGWVRPTVFQGNYSAFARRAEAELLPTLRRLGIALYAYSPLAGGFLARRNADELFGEAGGRFARAGGRSLPLYQGLYSEKPKLVAALQAWARIADESGCESPAELGYRWIAWNSALDPELGDKVTIGASRVEQVSQVVGWLAKGPMSEDVVKAIDALWEDIKDESPLDNWHK
ncbi:NADP-dependent oxidoreductase domain-containing protein [Phialemonium atrogriseum]|uniref:NADP-dependent oxidoreductase domain-containing protein n=1 Tax=Phialemonium atrogriseum TaxID=1093897 RepID=A0AAJ0BVK6_9PEZI|nr:NADP-dependent oxidoreductase domain-containing protein [Phialemonium atrogriseum]KAK1765061.1 NADP-dependent oxidoreductase domain-containing protein [Phialemonium atrogriseum]